jgi:hypothetical protein
MPRYRSSYNTKQKTARLIYEPALQGYSLAFSYDAAIVEFIKKVIPSHKRTTSGPPAWTWFFGSEYYDIVKTLFDGHSEYKLTIVTQAEVEEMQARQAETRNTWRPAEFSIETELQKFESLLCPVDTKSPNGDFSKELRNWSRVEATRNYRRAAILYHPDKGGDPVKMAELNNTWALLKEGYYIK